MSTKRKISEIAKDFGVSNKELLDLIKDHASTDKRYSASSGLEGEELERTIELLTRRCMVDSFAELEASARPMKSTPPSLADIEAHSAGAKATADKTTAPAGEKKADKPKAAKPAKPEAKSEGKAKPAAKKPEGEAKKPESEVKKPAAEVKKPESEAKKPAAEVKKPENETVKPEAENKPVVKRPPTIDQPIQGARILQVVNLTPDKPQQRRNQQGGRNNGAQGQRQGDRQRPAQGQRSNQQPRANEAAKPVEQTKPMQRPTPVMPTKPVKTPAEIAALEEAREKQRKKNASKQNKPKERRPEGTIIRPQGNAANAVQGAVIIQQASATESESAVKRRVVDTRSGHVDIEKYNTKYDDLARAKSGSAAEQSSGKQKLTQKSQQYRQKGKGGRNQHRETEAERLKRIALERKLKPVEITIPDEITVGELASRLKMTSAEVIKKLMMLGVMASINDVIDFDTAYLAATELGAKAEKEVVVSIEERIIDDSTDDDDQLIPRSPVVVVMGHVDHGKTSLLDYIRNAHVTEGEAGGITQHIGAYRVNINDREITFLDTPGHEAFTTMRARGAQATDIAVLVVAADDGIMPQTVEAINHAKAAGISIIVAINKMDKPGADPDSIMQQLTEYELVPEAWGGDVICVPVSAKTGMGIDDLLENIVLVADMKELKANPYRAAKGIVIEARLDKGRGPIATVLVQNGTLHDHDIVVAGTAVGRIRVMTDEHGAEVTEAGPSIPVEIVGLDSVPTGGDIFNAVSDERLARELVEQRRMSIKEEQFRQQSKVTLDNMFDQMREGDMKELKIIVKADVQGSVEAVRQSLEKLTNDEVRVHIIHGAVGGVTESDVMLADASNAIIVGFNVRPDPTAAESATRAGVDIRLYRIIYDCIEEIGSAMKGMLAPKTRVVDLGRAEVRQTIKISSIGTIAGSYVVSGKIERRALIRVVRDGIIVAEDAIKSLRRFKDDVKEVQQGYECGIGLEKFNDIKEGDYLEAFIVEEYRD